MSLNLDRRSPAAPARGRVGSPDEVVSSPVRSRLVLPRPQRREIVAVIDPVWALPGNDVTTRIRPPAEVVRAAAERLTRFLQPGELVAATDDGRLTLRLRREDRAARPARLQEIAVPLVNRAVRGRESRRARLAIASALPVLCAAVGIGYLLWATVLTTQDPENWSVWNSAPSRGVDFALGMGLAVLVATGVRLGRGPRLTLGLGGVGALVVLVLSRPFDVPTLSEWWHPLYSAAVATLLAGIVLHEGPWSRAFEWRPLVFIGSLGYGVYLIHEPVMRLLGSHGLLPEARPGSFFLWTAVLVAVPSTALAWLSSRTVEAAGLRLLATMDRSGRPRDYYEHYVPDDGPAAGPEASSGTGAVVRAGR